MIVPPRLEQRFEVGRRVRMLPQPGIVPEGIHGTIVEVMAVGFSMRVDWDDGQRRGIFGWCHFSYLEEIREEEE